MGRLVLLLAVVLSISCLCSAQEPSPPPGAALPAPGPAPAVPPALPAPDTAQYAFEAGASTSSGDAAIKASVELLSVPKAQIRFAIEVHSDVYMRDSWLRLRVTDQQGNPVHETPLEFHVAPGLNKGQFLWDAEKIPLGVYTARIDLVRGADFEECGCQIMVSKLSEPVLQEWIARVSNDAANLNQYLKDLANSGPLPPYAGMRAGLANDYAARARESFSARRWNQANYFTRYAEDTVKSVRVGLVLANARAELTEPIPDPKLANIELRNGAFYAEGRPVFLMGYRGSESVLSEMARLESYGLNFVAFDVDPATAPGSTSILESGFDVAERLNLSVACLLSPFNVPQSDPAFADRPAGLMDEDVRGAVSRHLESVAAAVRGEPMLSSVGLIQDPAFDFEGPSVREGFIARLHELYPDVDTLNRVWKTRFIKVDEASVVWDPAKRDYHMRPSFQYDWQMYHLWLGTELLRLLEDRFGQAAPSVPTFIQLSDGLLAPGETKRGINDEAIAQLMDLNGCAVADSPSDSLYALRYPHSSLMYSLLKSLAPERPLINSRHLLIKPDDPFGVYGKAYIHSTMWEAAMSGLNASALTAWEGTVDGQPGGFLDRPECVEAYATACLDLNRLGEIVAAFQQAPSEVAILWSMPARIFNDGTEYLASLQRAYEGLSFGGRRIRFITEAQIAANGLDGIRVLAIPRTAALGDEMTDDRAFKAIRAFAEAGGVIIKTGDPIPFDARGRSRQETLNPTANTVLVRGTETASSFLDAIDAAYSNGGIDSVPRAINEYGYPLEGVRTLYLEHQGRQFLYVLNLRKVPVNCLLVGPYQEGRDLIAGRTVEFPAMIAPLDPMLLQMKPVEGSDYLPTAKVDEPPVVPERQARTTKVQGGAPRQP